MTAPAYTTETPRPPALTDPVLVLALQEVAGLIRREVKPKRAARIRDALASHADRLDHNGRGDKVVCLREPRPHSFRMAERSQRAAIIRYLVAEAGL